MLSRADRMARCSILILYGGCRSGLVKAGGLGTIFIGNRFMGSRELPLLMREIKELDAAPYLATHWGEFRGFNMIRELRLPFIKTWEPSKGMYPEAAYI